MDRNALTEQRRKNVIGLLKSMTIRKNTEEGFDKDDVYGCMQQLCDLYEASIENLQDTYEAEIGSLKDKYQKYDENNELYVSLIVDAKKISNELINQAKEEVDNILASGKEKIEEQEKELEAVRESVEEQRDVMLADLDATKEAVEAEKAAMKLELEAEKEKCAALKNRYQQQINTMDGTFEEIKTNVLRTAGQIDNLKGQLTSEDLEINWNSLEEDVAIELPEGDVVLEDIIDDVPAAEVDVEIPADEAVETLDVDESLFADADLVEEAAETAEVEVSDEAAEVVEEAAEEAEEAVEEAEAPAEEVEEVSLESLFAGLGSEPIEDVPAPEAADPDASELNLDELDFDDLDVKLTEISDLADAVKSDIPVPQTEVAEPTEEISFEGLEELFKEE